MSPRFPLLATRRLLRPSVFVALLGITIALAIYGPVRSLNAASSALMRLAAFMWMPTPALQANGKIAFVSGRDGNNEIYAMNADGTAQTRLTNNAAIDERPVYSPDGSKIVFSSSRDGNNEIYVMNADGTGQARLTNNAADDGSPAFSPDGGKIVFDTVRDGNFEIYVMNADGTGQTRLTNNAAFDAQPDYSPDGSKIAFTSDRDGNLEIYAMNADGTGQTNLTNNAAGDEIAAYSPDGSKIAFASNRDGNSEVYVMNADGTGQTRITNNAATDRLPAYSPDGGKIAFMSTRDGNDEIYVMNANGTGQTRLTINAASDFLPKWQTLLSCTPPPANGVAWYRGEGNANDNLGANNGTLDGGVTIAPGFRGLAFSFDGVDGRVTVPDSASISPASAISIDAWIKPTSVSSEMVIVGKHDNSVAAGKSYLLTTGSTGNKLRFGVNEDGVSQVREVETTNPVLTANVFTHVAATFDTSGQVMKVYVNGVDTPTTLTSSFTVNSIFDSTTPVRIGSLINGAALQTLFFSGLMDEVHLYSRALTATEVKDIYDAKSAGKCLASPTQLITVSNTNDSGPGSLRQAMLDSNASPGTQTIDFNLPGAGVQTITPLSALPTITDPVIIDGYTQPGASANTLATGNDAVLLIELDGTSAGAGASGLNITAGSSTVRGLVINRFSQKGIRLATGGGNTIEGNFIGTNAAGTAALGNVVRGVSLEGSPNNVIGGLTPAARNLLSGNTGYGIQILSSGSTGNQVQGNYIGTNFSGTAALANGETGLDIGNAANNTVGGTTAGARNVISGNTINGISLRAGSNIVQGNYIGTNAAGAAAIANAFSGVQIDNASGNTIGGTAAGARNVISGNGNHGVEIQDGGATGNFVQNNLIGTQADGVTALGNAAAGVQIRTSAANNDIGGTAAGAANVIAFNQCAFNQCGVSLAADAGAGNLISGNSIHSNGTTAAHLGLDLGTDGITTNDANDADTGANNLQNFPVLTSATSSGGDTTIVGTFNSTASTNNFRIEFFSNPTCDPSGNGEGQTYLGFTTVNTDASGDAIINTTLTGVTLNPGLSVTATATDPANNTSEFSACFQSAVIFTVTNTNDSGAGSLRQAITDSNNTAGVQTIAFNIPGGGVQTITPASALPIISQPVIIDGTTQPGYAGTPLIELNGTSAGAGVNGLFITAGSSTVRALVINRFTGSGISIQTSGGNTVTGCYIGTNAGGTAALANSQDGINISTATNTIGGAAAGEGNVISGQGNGFAGISINGSSASGNIVQGNFIGTNAAGTTAIPNTFGLFVSGPNNQIGGTTAGAGNLISGNSNTGLRIFNSTAIGNTVQGNFIGTNTTGTSAVANTFNGVQIAVSTTSNTIGGVTVSARNIISGNGLNGVSIESSSSNNTVLGNYIGTNAAGTTALPNAVQGININTANNNTVGGTVAGARNVISGNSGTGVSIAFASTGNKVQGNFIGTDATGTAKIANATGGVSIVFSPTSNLIGGDDAADGTLDGVVAARNVISGNGNQDISIQSASNNTVQGNFIGTLASGTAAPITFSGGVSINDAANNTIGGTTAGAGNVISGSGGIVIQNSGATGNTVQGNLIGTDATGTSALGNLGSGIQIFSPAASNIIGGTGAGAANLIAFNAQDGVQINGTSATSNRISGNSIHSNGTTTLHLGIDLVGTDGVNANDAGDADTGANNLQNYPVITSATSSGGNTTIQGTLNSMASTAFAVEFFSNPTCDTSTFGEGKVFLGSASVTSDGSGNATINSTLPVTVANGHFMTATATDPAGNTSEFSQCRTNNPSAQIYSVSTTADSGAGSLRQAILDANSNSGFTDTIAFNIAGGGVQTISPSSALPGITDPVLIDGTTQPAYAGTPIIELNGTSAGASADGFNITAVGSTIRGFVINRFGGQGIEINGEAADGNTIEGCFIGTDAAGTTDLGNATDGVLITNGADNNTVGGIAATPGTAPGNLISGNGNVANTGLDAIEINGTATTGNVVQGNMIGLNAAGTAALQNEGAGVRIAGAATNTVGGNVVGAGNVISGNKAEGVLIINTGATGNVVQRNLIGTNAAGTAAFGNVFAGVRIIGPAANTTVGGTTAAARNVISGNTNSGVRIETSSGNVVQGNYVGTNAAGTAAVANVTLGVFVSGATNQIGGTAAGAGNVISGNSNTGLQITSASATGNTVQGNLIGTNATGTAAVANTFNGVQITSSTASNTIGGTTAAARNIISGNGLNGVSIQSSSGNTVLGNYIGTNAAGAAALPNAVQGVDLNTANNNTIGGTVAGAGNVISGNSSVGVSIGIAGTGNKVQGNFIGTNAAGTGAIPNSNGGVSIVFSPSLNLIGGDDAADGTVDGIIAARNVISGNGSNGINIQSASSNTVQGNFIGTNAAGTAALANSNNAISLNAAGSSVIGGTTAGAGNVISGNGTTGVSGDGVNITGSGATGNVVQGNLIGTNAAGTAAIANAFNGVRIQSSATGNTIGGITAGAQNVLSGNTANGVLIQTSAATNTVQGNFIGTDITGAVAVPNLFAGVNIFGPGGSNTIGGATAAARNVISGNTGRGVIIQSASLSNTIRGNFIGVAADGTSALGNTGGNGFGVVVSGSSNNNAIGGTAAGEGNVIAFNALEGVFIGSSITGSSMQGNSIHSNTNLGIDLNGGGVTPNDVGDADTGGNSLQNFPALTSAISDAGSTTVTGTLDSTANATFRLEFFSNPACDASGNGEGQVFLGFVNVTTDGAGSGSFNTTLAVATTVGQVVTATATNTATNNTSEFSACQTVTLPPSGTIQFSAANYSANEGAGTVTITVTRAGGSFGAVTAAYADTPGTATTPADYANGSGTVSFADGDATPQTFNVTINDDNLDENNESFSLALSIQSGAATLGSPATASATINDDDGPPSLSINDVTLAEGNSGTIAFTFTVSLLPASAQTVGVNFLTADGTATVAGADFQTATGSLTFNPGDTSKPVTVQVNGDTQFEPNETFFVDLSIPSNATISDNQAQGTITNDDSAIINITGHVADDTSAALAGLTINLTGSQTTSTVTDASGNYSFSSLASSGNYTVTPAPSNYDFTPPSHTFNNPAGDQTADFSGIQVRAQTPAGNNVTVQIRSTIITFASVSNAGTTTVHSINPATAGTLPSGYALNGGSIAVDATTTAVFSGAVVVSVTVPAINDPVVFSEMRVLHGEGGPLLVDRTILAPDTPAPNFGIRRLAARVTSLSPFVVARNFMQTISGSVTNSGGTGIEGINLALSSSPERNTTTDANGNYSFTNVPAGSDYTVTPSEISFLFAPANRTFNTLSADQTADFIASPAFFTISGHVTGTGGAPLAGATMTLSGATSSVTNTDAAGDYSFTNVPAGGDYFVTADKLTTDFLPTRREFNNLIANQTAADFSGAPQPNPTPEPPPSDDFGGAVRDPEKWNEGTLTQPDAAADPVVTVTQENGMLVIEPREDANGPSFNGYVSTKPIDLTTTPTASLEVVQPASGVGAVTIFSVGTDSDNWFRFVVQDGSLPPLSTSIEKHGGPIKAGETGQIMLFQFNRNGSKFSAGLGYDPQQFRFWRFRFDTPANKVHLETSPNAQVWTIRLTADLAAGVNGLISEIAAGTIGPTPGAGSAAFDNYALADTRIEFSAPAFSAREDGDSAGALVTVTRTGVTDNPSTVGFATEDGTASSNSDYTSIIGTLRFEIGEATKTFRVRITNDTASESDETIRLVLFNAVGGVSLGGGSRAALTILDDDANGANQIDDTGFFVRQNYLDFLNREPDPPGLEFWSGQINTCGTSPQCIEVRRINVSAAFFLSIEFQETGFVAYRFYEASFDRRPVFNEFIPDSRLIGRDVVVGTPGWEQQLEQNKHAFASLWVGRQAFKDKYDSLNSADYVDTLYRNAGVTPTPEERTALIAELVTGRTTRAEVLLKIVEDAEFKTLETNRAFVFMEYIGYLRRDPDQAGFDFWLAKLEQFGGDFRRAEMVKAFITSTEYRARFGRP